jgi:hypothetical protein
MPIDTCRLDSPPLHAVGSGTFRETRLRRVVAFSCRGWEEERQVIETADALLALRS